MGTSRFQHTYRESASKLHRAVGDILRASPLRHQGLYQEYPVKRVNPSYSESSHHFDWVLTKLRVVIECHGRQHYEAVTFGGDVENMVSNFRAQQRRDDAKREAALNAGWAYVEIPYHLQKQLSAEMILGMIQEAQEELDDWEQPPEPEPTPFELEQKKRHEEMLERARKHRKERYQKQRDAIRAK